MRGWKRRKQAKEKWELAEESGKTWEQGQWVPGMGLGWVYPRARNYE